MLFSADFSQFDAAKILLELFWLEAICLLIANNFSVSKRQSIFSGNSKTCEHQYFLEFQHFSIRICAKLRLVLYRRGRSYLAIRNSDRKLLDDFLSTFEQKRLTFSLNNTGGRPKCISLDPTVSLIVLRPGPVCKSRPREKVERGCKNFPLPVEKQRQMRVCSHVFKYFQLKSSQLPTN